MNNQDFIKDINCHGYTLFEKGVIPELNDIDSVDAYIFLNKLDKIKKPEPGCIVAFRSPIVIERKPWYRHSGIVIYTNPVWIIHKEDYKEEIKENTLDQLKNSRDYKGDKIFYFIPKELDEVYYKYLEEIKK